MHTHGGGRLMGVQSNVNVLVPERGGGREKIMLQFTERRVEQTAGDKELQETRPVPLAYGTAQREVPTA